MNTETLPSNVRSKFTTSDGCWIWNAATSIGTGNRNGYGKLTIKGKAHRAHRLIYELLVGPIPAGKFLCHTCDVPSCVNPMHMVVGDAKWNVRDMVSKGRHGPRKMARPKNRGHKNGHSHFTAEDVDRIRSMRSAGAPIQQIADEFGCSISTVSRVTHFQTHWESAPDRRKPLSPVVASDLQ